MLSVYGFVGFLLTEFKVWQISEFTGWIRPCWKVLDMRMIRTQPNLCSPDIEVFSFTPPTPRPPCAHVSSNQSTTTCMFTEHQRFHRTPTPRTLRCVHHVRVFIRTQLHPCLQNVKPDLPPAGCGQKTRRTQTKMWERSGRAHPVSQQNDMSRVVHRSADSCLPKALSWPIEIRNAHICFCACHVKSR